MKHIEVVAGIIINDNKILCVQRGESKLPYISKKFEFPGGKMEPGETKKDAVKREIFEELKMEISVEEEFLTVIHEYPDFKITMHSLICHSKNQNVTLTEHISYNWLSQNELEPLDWAAADLPIVNKLIISNL